MIVQSKFITGGSKFLVMSDSDWVVLHSETFYLIVSSTHQFGIENKTNFYRYYRIFAVEGHGPNPGLSYVQIFVHCD